MIEMTIARKLLQNKFICLITDEVGYHWLKTSDNFERMTAILEPLGMRLTTFSEGEVFAGINVAVDETDKKRVVKEFEDIHYNIYPIIDILTALASADEDGDSLYMGKIIKQDKLVITVNDNQEFATRLKKLAEFTNSVNKPNDEQVGALLNKLQKDELLYLVNPEKKVYRVTGKMEYINRIIEFINENYLEKENETHTQQGLDL